MKVKVNVNVNAAKTATIPTAESTTPTADATAAPARCHKHYDVAYEILCTLSTSPVPAASICADLGIVMSQFSAAVKKLRNRGYFVHSSYAGPLKKNRAVWIGVIGLPSSLAACERYWDQVYGDQQEVNHLSAFPQTG